MAQEKDCVTNEEKMAKMKEMEGRKEESKSGGFLGFLFGDTMEMVNNARDAVQAASDIKELNKKICDEGHGLPPAGAQNPSGKGAALGK